MGEKQKRVDAAAAAAWPAAATAAAAAATRKKKRGSLKERERENVYNVCECIYVNQHAYIHTHYILDGKSKKEGENDEEEIVIISCLKSVRWADAEFKMLARIVKIFHEAMGEESSYIFFFLHELA